MAFDELHAQALRDIERCHEVIRELEAALGCQRENLLHMRMKCATRDSVEPDIANGLEGIENALDNAKGVVG